ncbi:MAG: hypothetical protein II007_00735 [Gammaproteobacteria bacterium]|nr:hypothetical protein [Gammaproteobacteria bacterium]
MNLWLLAGVVVGLVDQASEQVMTSILDGGDAAAVISQPLLQAVAAATKATTREWLESARNVVTFANDSGTYDELAAYLQATSSKRRIGFLG